MSIINNRHDVFFKKILSDKGIAIEYFSNYLPDYVSSRLDFDTLEQTSESYVSEELKSSYADLVFTCRTKNSDGAGSAGSVRVSILIEHKSYVDKFVPFQIGSYIFSGYLKQIAQKENLSVIIPILFYHGKRGWAYKSLPELFQISNFDNYLREFIPDFRCLFHNLGEMPDTQIKALSNQFLAASLLTLKHYMDEKWLEDHAGEILKRLESVADWSLGEALIVYFFSHNKAKRIKFVKTIESFPFTLKDKIMSTLDSFIEEGKKQGIALGIETEKRTVTQNLLAENKFSIAEIARLVGASVEYVEKVRKDGLI